MIDRKKNKTELNYLNSYIHVRLHVELFQKEIIRIFLI